MAHDRRGDYRHQPATAGVRTLDSGRCSMVARISCRNLVCADVAYGCHPDQIPIRQRATVAGLGAGMGLMVGGLYGQILVAQMFKTVPSAYISLAISCFIMIGLFLLVMPDKQLPREYVQPFRAKEILATYWLSPRKYPDFGLIWLARCLIFLGYTTTVNFMFYYLEQAVHYPQHFPGQTPAQGVQLFFTVMVVSIVVASLIGGMISDKVQRRRVFVALAGVLMMIGMLLYAFFSVCALLRAVLITRVKSVGSAYKETRMVANFRGAPRKFATILVSL
jgi:hypothetical protein